MDDKTIIGITGLPASGKTVFSESLHKALADLGVSCTLINADTFAKEVLSDKNIRHKIQTEFGCDPLNPDEVIAKIYTQGDMTMRRYNSTMRHILLPKLQARIKSLTYGSIVILESALIMELNIYVDTLMLVVSNNKDLMQNRTQDQICRHRVLSELQIPLEYKRRYCDVLFENNKDLNAVDSTTKMMAKYFFETVIVRRVLNA